MTSEPAKHARIVAFLASGDHDYVTGQVLTVDGGFLG
jgi:NAD(P)-dependent dehydrogenase (short-subunit alcohol dehydrogenase family)